MNTSSIINQIIHPTCLFSRLHRCVFATVVGASLVLPLQAEEFKKPGDVWLLAKYDLNGDQAISLDEVTLRRDRIFAHLDADADGLVTFDEYQSLDIKKRELILKARFDKLDSDGDGELSPEEYRSYLGSFESFDANGDGRLTRDEIENKRNDRRVKVANEKVSDTHCLLWVCVRTSLD
jgi:Ca2+-binding EF-hand superfamily protein